MEELVQERTAELTLANQQLHQEIAERKRVEEELRQAKEIAEEAQRLAETASRAKSEFLARMSHELRTPLHIITGMSHAALETELTAKQRKYMENIQSASGTLVRIINDILDFSRIETGKLTLKPVNFRLNDILEHMFNQVRGEAEKKNLSMRIEVGHDVPLFLFGDPVCLKHILIHLTDNAIKFTKYGEIVVRVEQAQKSDFPEEPGFLPDRTPLRFSVQDSGIGIPPEKLSIIFDAFMQVDGSSTRKYGGTGLGLAICKRLVEMMGGRIWLESKPGQGSIFYFTAEFGQQSEERKNGREVSRIFYTRKQVDKKIDKR